MPVISTPLSRSPSCAQGAGTKRRPRDAVAGKDGREDDQRQGAEEALPGGQRQHVYLVAPAEDLGDHRARGEAEGGDQREDAAHHSVDAPGFDDQHQSGQAHSDRQPLPPSQPLAEKRPSQDEYPELPRIGEHARVSGAFGRERGRAEPHEAAHLQQAYQGGQTQRPGADRTPQNKQQPEE